MSEDKLEKTPPDPVFAEGYEVYIDAFIKAFGELEDIKVKEKELAYRKAKLNETVIALRPLVFKQDWDINTLTLSDAIRFVFNTVKRPLSALDLRTKLEDLDYNLAQFDNPLANIHTALKRMGDTNELYVIEKDDKKKTFEPGPNLKPVPEPAGAEVPSYGDLMGMLGENSTGEK